MILFVVAGLMLPSATIYGQRRAVTATARITLTIIAPAVHFSPAYAIASSKLAGVCKTPETGMTFQALESFPIQPSVSKPAGNFQIHLKTDEMTAFTAKQLNGVSKFEITCMGG